MKHKRGLLALTTTLCLLPMLAGLLLFSRLPPQLAVHWRGGEPDRFVTRAAAVFALPLFFCAIHLLAVVKRENDPRRAAHGKTIGRLLWWAVPLISILVLSSTYAIALGYNLSAYHVVYVLAGCVFVVLGNYLPKNRRNYTLGIKLPWTLDDPDIWNKTHRLMGPLYIAGGFVLILQAFLIPGRWPGSGVPPAVILLLLATPRVYALVLYRRKAGNGET